eukprot:Phypoly_transcript_03092.p1 GENE.Phypoly_transcript_03092~~Phypoly_transcript_03092.p1  ORF type:complete len:847 (+),score=180.92 Phypoly_transcript_03092:122-2542(+)
MSKPPADFRTLVRLTSFAHMVAQGPAAPKTDATWVEEKECLILLLKARMMLRDIVEGRLKQERFALGNLSVAEIQNILKNQKEDADTDWIAEIQELKRNMVAELRKNHQLEKELSKLDKRIALLIKHRSNIKEIIAAAQKKAKAVKHEGATQFTLTPKQLEGYQNLFYLLQTEPHYLGRLVTLVQPDKMEQFLDTVILTLFGDAFSPREEYLILSLFTLAIAQETRANSNVAELISMESVVPKMIITYNRRKQGHEYLKQVITPILETVTNIADLNLELSCVQIYQALITDIEIQTGAKSSLNRDLPEEQISELPDVKALLAARVEKCISICNMFFDGIISSLSRLPYGIRWICKQIHSIAKQKWDTSDDDIGKVIGYFVYYRFMNVAIVTPDSHALTGKEVSMLARRNLVVVAKVLQTLFSLNQFQKVGNERWLMPLNNWINSKTGLVRKYFQDLIDVPDPSDYLRVDKYNELTLKISPVIIISLSEMFQTHLLILDNLSALAKEKNDPLNVIMKDLVAPPVISSDELEREIQLTLVNKFKEKLEDDISSSVMVLAATKELVIHVFRGMPQQANVLEQKKGKSSVDTPSDDLIAILNTAQQFGKDNNQQQLVTNVTKILGNLKQLQDSGAIIGSGDNYQSFLRAIALEVANRQALRELQHKERTRLFLALKEIRKYGDYLNDQIAQYHDYLKTVLGHYGPRDPSKRTKPIKFSYKELAKKGVIVSSEVPKIGQKSTAFFLSTDTPGVFDIEAKMAGKTVDSMQLELDELLERSHSNDPVLKLENVTLDVNLTLHLLNRYFLRKVK